MEHKQYLSQFWGGEILLLPLIEWHDKNAAEPGWNVARSRCIFIAACISTSETSTYFMLVLRTLIIHGLKCCMNGTGSKIVRHRVQTKIMCCKHTPKLDRAVKHDVTVQIQIQNENAQLKLPNGGLSLALLFWRASMETHCHCFQPIAYLLRTTYRYRVRMYVR